MGPVILNRAGLQYAAVVHGSDLSYTVIPDRERFGPYAQEACHGAAGILVGSGHIAARLRQAVDDPGTNAKVRLGPPGVDTTLFSPIPPSDRPTRLRSAADRIRRGVGGGADGLSAAKRGLPGGASPDPPPPLPRPGTAISVRPPTPSTGSPTPRARGSSSSASSSSPRASTSCWRRGRSSTQLIRGPVY